MLTVLFYARRRPIASGGAAVVLALALGCAAPAAETADRVSVGPPDANMPRESIEARYRWRLDPLFESDDAFADALSAAAARVDELQQYAGKLADPAMLRDCLELYFDTRLATNRLTLYANMRFDSYQGSTELQAMNERALKLLNDFMAASTFIRQEVLGLDSKALESAYEAESRLEAYRPYIEQLRRRRTRVLTSQAERVLALAGDNLWAEIDLNEIPSDFEKTFNATLNDIPLPSIEDGEGRSVQLTLSNYVRFRASSDRCVRREAVEKLFGALKSYQNVLASTLAGQIGFNIFLARSRGYDTALEAYLDKDEIDPAVYRRLIETVKANLQPLHDYVALRKQVLKLDELHIYDLYAALVPQAESDIPYERAAEILPEALAPLGETYVELLRHGLEPENGWIDLYPHKHKQSGAFSSSVFGVHPYVKMNYFNQLDDLSTLAHEYGHALHSHLAMGNQPYVTASYVPFIAEIASTINEKLLSDYLLSKAQSDAERLHILCKLAEAIRTTIYRQTLFAEFELAAHSAVEEGKPLTSEVLNAQYEKLIRTYYGPALTVGENDHIEWAYIPHFYYKYYIYSYATGLSAGIALAERIQQGGEKERDAYLGMLKGGGSRPPLDLVNAAGVDLTQPTAVEAAARLMAKTVEKMRAILKRQG